MGRLKVFGIVVWAVVSVMAVNVACASAVTLTSPEGTVYTSTIKAEAGEITLHGAATITCQKSTIEGKVEQHGAEVPAGGKLSSLTFSECGENHVTVKSAGSLEVGSGSGEGTATSSGAEISVQITSLGITCVFTTNSTDFGTLTGSNSTNAVLDIESAAVPRTGGSIFCGSSGEMTGSYKVTTPSTLSGD